MSQSELDYQQDELYLNYNKLENVSQSELWQALSDLIKYYNKLENVSQSEHPRRQRV